MTANDVTGNASVLPGNGDGTLDAGGDRGGTFAFAGVAAGGRLTAAMTARSLLLLHLAELSEEDVQALLGVAERLRAKHLAPRPTGEIPAAPPGGGPHHPERFGALVGSVRFAGDVESPVEDAAAWTSDERSFGA